MKKIFYFILILVALILYTSFQTYVYYTTRVYGNISFYRFADHFFGYLDALGSLGCTLLAWKWLGRLKPKKKKFLYAFALSLLLFSPFTSVLYVSIRAYYGGSTSLEYLWGNLWFMFSFSHLFISGITIGYLFFKESALFQKELLQSKLELESLQLQLLKKNIEPHFLFNSLSILSSLARKDSAQIDGFIEKLAEVYRYFLLHNEHEKVSLKKELQFLQKYIVLTRHRFDNAYDIAVSIDNQEGEIVPFALQACIENAIKHNEASTALPLVIEIKRRESTLIVSNPIRPVAFRSNTGTGLWNLSRRYQLIFKKEIRYGQEGSRFAVEIPVIAHQPLLNQEAI
ncbi:MAG TPA: histidine kinase [Flavobacterium sp.]|nr:histidine kinase [Flavobacterium sp.]